MDRDTLLNSTRTQFLAIFGQLIEAALRRSIGKLYDKAEKSKSSQLQRQLLDARSTLVSHERGLAIQIQGKLEFLLNRSFQTAYNTFRPSFFNASKSSTMALMDITAFEDELRVDIITSRFRSEVEEQLRDLNIRIAILFERNDIAERENPFRPYILTRSIILGIETIEVEPELLVVLTDQLAEELLAEVVLLYEKINEHLSECGVAAQLQFKSQRMPSDLTNPVGYDPENSAEAQAKLGQAAENQAHHGHMQHPRHNSPLSSRAAANSETTQKIGKIEQLIHMVRNKNALSSGSRASAQVASAHPAGFGGDAAAGGGSDNVSGAQHIAGPVGQLMNQAGSTVSGWMEGAHDVGEALRRVFFGAARSTGGELSNQPAQEQSSAGNQRYSDGLGNDPGQAHASTTTISISPQLSQALRIPIPETQEMTGLDGEVRNLIIERRDSLNAVAADQHEKMTIDIVAMLFEFILKDHQVPAEVRAQLGRLQFSVLKMALMDSALLTKKSHPARLLVNRIGSISVGLQQIDPTGERISDEICRIVEELLASDSENPELFSKMLDQLDMFIARELLASNANVEHAVNVLVNAEHRSQRFNHASVGLEKMLNDMVITPYLRRFLIDTWSHVIERVERNPKADSTRFRLLVPNLLWSILPKASRDDRSMLLQIIPALVPVLREGMGLVAWLPEHQQELLNWLVDAHTTVMRAPINTEAVVTLLEVQRHFHDFVYPPAIDSDILPEPHKATLNRKLLDEAIKELESELKEVGLMHDLTTQPELLADEAEDEADLALQQARSAAIDSGEPTSNAEELGADPDLDNGLNALMQNQHPVDELIKEVDILDRLRSGVVVEINLSGNPARGRLNWISPNSSNLILTITGQAAPSIISVRMFRRMLKSDRARFVEVAPLFERAVQSLLESADQLDLASAA